MSDPTREAFYTVAVGFGIFLVIAAAVCVAFLAIYGAISLAGLVGE